jgi:hypothetical protein
MTMKQIKRWSEKAWCHERIRVTWEEIKGDKQNYGWGGIIWNE